MMPRAYLIAARASVIDDCNSLAAVSTSLAAASTFAAFSESINDNPATADVSSLMAVLTHHY